jgi:hypothetical protein
MDEQLPKDTREFMAMWNSATADHLTHRLSRILQDLTSRVRVQPPLSEAQAAGIAPVLVRAFQVAASPEGGVHAAVQFLAEYGDDMR